MTNPTPPPKSGTLTDGLLTLNAAAIEGLLAVETQGVPDFLKKQVTKFLAKVPENLRVFYDEMNRGDLASARESIHKLAGYAGMVGAHSLRLHGLQIETAIDQGDTLTAGNLAQTLPDQWNATTRDFETLLKRLP